MATLIISITNNVTTSHGWLHTNQAFYIMGSEGDITAISSESDSTTGLCISHRPYEIYCTQIWIHPYE